MGLEAIRVDLTTAVEAAKASFAGGYPLVIEYDNRIIVDTKKQTNPFLCVEFKFLSAEQTALGDSPEQRFWGHIVLSAAVPEGAGKASAHKLLEHFYPKLQRKSFGSVRTTMSTMAGDRPHLGWVYVTVLVPFWSDQPS